MSLDDQLGTFAGKSAPELDPAAVHANQRLYYEKWLAKELGHFLHFDYTKPMPDWIEQHLRRLSELRGASHASTVTRLRALYLRLVDRQFQEFRQDRRPAHVEEFLARNSQCYDLATRIVAALDDHLGLSPKQFQWKHVNQLRYAKEGLDYAARVLRIPTLDD